MVDHIEAKQITSRQMSVVNRRVRSMQRSYEILAHKMNNLSRTPRTQPLIDEFSTINLPALVTIEQCEAVQARVNRLTQIADSILSLNPYLIDVHSRNTQRKNLGDVQIDQNGTTIRLSDFLSIRGTTREAREDTMKRLLNDWLYEANESLNRKFQLAEMNLASIRKSKLKLPITSILRVISYLSFLGFVFAVLIFPQFSDWRSSGSSENGFVTLSLYFTILSFGVSSIASTHIKNFPIQFAKVYERELSGVNRAKEQLLARREKLERLLLRKARTGGRVNESFRLFTIYSPRLEADNKAKSYLFQESTFYKKHYGFALFLTNTIILASLLVTAFVGYLYFFAA